MEILQTLFQSVPVTTSITVILVITLLVVALSMLLLEAVKFIINQKAWKTEIINSWILYEIVESLLCKKGHVSTVTLDGDTYTLRKYDSGYRWEITYLTTSSLRVDSDGIKYSGGRGTVFKTEEEAISKTKGVKTKHMPVLKFNPYRLIAYIFVLDLMLYLFQLVPLETLILLSVATLVYSVRWVSGKLASNVNKTNNHEERLTNLEDKDK